MRLKLFNNLTLGQKNAAKLQAELADYEYAAKLQAEFNDVF